MTMKHSKGMMYGREKDAMGRIGPEREYAVEFDAPEDAGLEGQSGEASVMWKRKPNGKVCIVSINGATIPNGDDDEMPKRMPGKGMPEDEMDEMDS